VTGEWPRVRVEGIDTHLRRERDGSDQVVVRACVYLGTLLPADVRVDLVAGPGQPGAATREVGCPLWSAQSYDNGVFVFEASVSAPAMERAAGFGVRVAPHWVREEASALPPVIQRVEPPQTAWWGPPTADTYRHSP